MKYDVIVCDDAETYFDDFMGCGISFKNLDNEELQFITKIAFNNNYEIMVSKGEGD